MNDLTTTSDLAAHFKMPKSDMSLLLKQLNVPSQTIPFGNRPFAVYEKAPTIETVTRALAERATASKSVDKPAVAVQQVSPDALEDLAARMGAVLDGIAKLSDQNVLLLRALNEQRAETYVKVNALQEAVDALLAREPMTCNAVKAQPTTLTPPAVALKAVQQPPKVDRHRIAIVGLAGAQIQTIDKEFGGVFDITHIAIDAANNRNVGEKVARCKIVVLVSTNSSNSIMALTSASGSRLVRVIGGLSALRNKLTDLYVKLADEKSVAA